MVTGGMVVLGMVRSAPQPVRVVKRAKRRATLARDGTRRRVRRAKASGIRRAKRIAAVREMEAAAGATPVSAVTEMV